MVRSRVFAAAATAALLAPSITHAELLGIGVDGPPVILYDSTGNTVFDPTTGSFTANAIPLAVQFQTGAPPRSVTGTGPAMERSVSISIILDSSGGLVSGVMGDDFTVVGQVDVDGDGSPEYSGILLSGEVTAFGFQDTGGVAADGADKNVTRVMSRAGTPGMQMSGDIAPSRTGAVNASATPMTDLIGFLQTDFFDLRVRPTGGSMLALFNGDDIGVELTSERSNFSGDFNVPFNGTAKGNIGPIDPIVGACCFADGTCDVAREDACAAQGGEYLGDDTLCTPAALADAGSYRLKNHPDSLFSPPPYGLRLDELFDVTPNVDHFTFDFEAPGSAMFLTYDGASTIRIHGIAFGGRDTSVGYDPAFMSFARIDFTYTNATTAPGDDDLLVPMPSPANGGTIEWLATGDVIPLTDTAAPYAFRFGDDDDDMGLGSFPGFSGFGWLLHPNSGGSGVRSDWVFASMPVCVGRGPCCLTDGSCTDGLTEAECDRAGGTYRGDGTDCATAECPGACCLMGGLCVKTTPSDCMNQRGVFLGEATTCDTVECPGACCFLDASGLVNCMELNTADCDLAGGISFGPGSSCTDVTCGGACCLADGTCVHTLSESACTTLAGDFNGLGSNCANIVCREPGACCVDDAGTCEVLSETDCAAAGGDYQGDGIECMPNTCRDPGACCVDATGTCQTLFEDECAAAGGTYQGDGSDCEITVCFPSDCCENGGLVSITFLFTGDDCSATVTSQPSDKTGCDDFGPIPASAYILSSDNENPDDGGANVWFTGNVPVGDTYTIRAANADESKLKSATFIHVFDMLGGTLLQTVEFHTSCSQDLFTGDQYGASLILNCRGEDEPGIGACCFPDDNTCVHATQADCDAMGGNYRGDDTDCANVDCSILVEDCCENGRPIALTFTYTGEGCDATVTQQPSDKTDCDEFGPLPDTVFVLATNDVDPDDTSAKVWFTGPVTLGADFTLAAANAGDSHFASATFIHFFDMDGGTLLQSVEFHTSCSQPLATGDQYGAARLIGCVGENEPPTGACCFVSDQSCVDVTEADCNSLAGNYRGDDSSCADADCTFVRDDCCQFGDIVAITMLYTGDDCNATNTAQNDDKVDCDDFGTLPNTVYALATDDANPDDNSAIVWFSGDVSVDDTFFLSATSAGEDKLKSATFIHLFDAEGGTLLQTVEFHTSCSQPLFTGDQYGASRVVDCRGRDEPALGACCFIDDLTCTEVTRAECDAMAGNYRGDETACTDADCSIAVNNCCENGDPVAPTFIYTGDDCSATRTSQSPDKVDCETFAALTPSVYILASDKANPFDGGANVWFAGDVQLDDPFTLLATDAGENKLKSETFIHIFDAQGGNRLQSAEFHTSCSQPLFTGDQYGASMLVDCVGENEPAVGACCFVLDGTCVETDEDTCAAQRGSFRGPLTACANIDCSIVQVDCCEPDKPSALVMRYTGEDCTASSNTQADDKFDCDDLATLPADVYILSTDDTDPNDTSAAVWFSGAVSLDGLFVLDTVGSGENDFKSATFIHIFDAPGGTLLQTVEFHTSCSQDLFTGDQFGASLLEACIP